VIENTKYEQKHAETGTDTDTDTEIEPEIAVHANRLNVVAGGHPAHVVSPGIRRDARPFVVTPAIVSPGEKQQKMDSNKNDTQPYHIS
jgi:hypothetical protein